MSDLELQKAANDFVKNVAPVDASIAKEELALLFLLVKVKSEVALLESLELTETDSYVSKVSQIKQLCEKLIFHNQLAI